MKMLVVGAGVIGTVYGAHVAASGSKVSVLSHGTRTSEVAAAGLSARDVLGGGRVDAEADGVPDAGGDYDVILVAVRRDQLASACAELAVLAGKPAVVFFGNNPAGRAAMPGDMPGEVYLGFPGVGGVMTRGVADYVRIRQQPTALPEASDPRLAALESGATEVRSNACRAIKAPDKTPESPYHTTLAGEMARSTPAPDVQTGSYQFSLEMRSCAGQRRVVHRGPVRDHADSHAASRRRSSTSRHSV